MIDGSSLLLLLSFAMTVFAFRVDVESDALAHNLTD
jgi:hypothetical protein